MTPTTSAVRAAAQQAVSAQPDADTRTQVMAALAAWGAWERAQRAAPGEPDGAARWKHWCARCGDPDCERRLLLSALLARAG